MPGTMPLAPDAVHLWLVRWDDDAISAEALAACATVIAPQEAARLEALVVPRHRRQQLVTRAFVRSVLSRHADVAPGAWRFVVGPHGKPEVDTSAELPPLQFNVSHVRGFAACAVSGTRRVGVDLERLDAERASPGIAERCFTVEELREMTGLAEQDWRLLFFRTWTLKEAYLKARGVGLNLEMNRLRAVLDGPGAPALDVDSEVADAGLGWQLIERRPDRHHVLALAVERRPELGMFVEEHRWSPPWASARHSIIHSGIPTGRE